MWGWLWPGPMTLGAPAPHSRGLGQDDRSRNRSPWLGGTPFPDFCLPAPSFELFCERQPGSSDRWGQVGTCSWEPRAALDTFPGTLLRRRPGTAAPRVSLGERPEPGKAQSPRQAWEGVWARPTRLPAACPPPRGHRGRDPGLAQRWRGLLSTWAPTWGVGGWGSFISSSLTPTPTPTPLRPGPAGQAREGREAGTAGLIPTCRARLLPALVWAPSPISRAELIITPAAPWGRGWALGWGWGRRAAQHKGLEGQILEGPICPARSPLPRCASLKAIFKCSNRGSVTGSWQEHPQVSCHSSEAGGRGPPL